MLIIIHSTHARVPAFPRDKRCYASQASSWDACVDHRSVAHTYITHVGVSSPRRACINFLARKTYLSWAPQTLERPAARNRHGTDESKHAAAKPRVERPRRRGGYRRARRVRIACVGGGSRGRRRGGVQKRQVDRNARVQAWFASLLRPEREQD